MAIISSRQEIEITLSGANLTASTTITAVDLSKSVIIYGGSTNTDTASGHTDSDRVRLDFASTTSVRATRNTSDNNTIVVACTIIEFDEIVDNVQHGEITITGTSQTDTITAVTLANSAVISNGYSTTEATNVVDDSDTYVELTDSTTVTAKKFNSNDTSVISYSVIEFVGSYISNIQPFTAELTTEVTLDETITSVSMADSILVNGGTSPSLNNARGSKGYMELSSSTAVTLTRLNDQGNLIFSGTVIEFNTGVIESVHRGVVSLAAAVTSNTVSLSGFSQASSALCYLGAACPNFQHDDESVKGVVTNDTTATFTRIGSAEDIDVSYEVWEFVSGAPPATGVRGVRVGSTTINEINLGSTEIKKVYLGTTLIHDTT